MGTRHLIAVRLDNEWKVAQYGQWDGYPDFRGIRVLEFLRDPTRMASMQYSLPKCSFLTDHETDKVEEFDRDWPAYFPQLSRNCSSDVLNLLNSDGLKLVNSISFAADGLFCEWAYVIDMDAKTFEVYKGLKTDHCYGRFAEMWDGKSEYRPVSLIKTYNLSDLPSDEKFLADMEKIESAEAGESV